MGKKAIILILSIIFLVGCNQQVDNGNDSADNDFIYTNHGAADYGLHQTSGTNLRTIEPIEKGVYYWVSIFEDSLDSSSKNMTYVLSFYNFKTGKSSIINSNTSEVCSYKNPVNCSSYFRTSNEDHVVAVGSYLRYYQDKLYFIGKRHDLETEIYEIYLYQMDLDGTNRQKVLEIPPETFIQPENYLFGGGGSQIFVIHHDNLYYSYGYNGIYKVDLNTLSQENIAPQLAYSKIGSFMFLEDDMYVNVLNYVNEHHEIEPRVYFKIDLKTNESERVNLDSTTDNAYFFKNQRIEAKERQAGVFEFVLVYNETEVKLTDAIIRPMKTSEGYLLFNIFYDLVGSDAKLILIDEKGLRLDEESFDNKYNFIFEQGVIGDYYYTYLVDNENPKDKHFARIPLKNGKIGEIEILDTFPSTDYQNE